ncbi:DUF58 domain-containing protein [Pseudactinotalea sp. HY158]|uniref:DUF58 domain-containing protein n=1 Tax=Pseudactinotalea sp. HY158 TaxID=2654547 RepID=UPI00129C24E9|nr:DUF58 domain-containing protein [Pseudactinotalea sp. HY158]QGH69838.1 DUF58 domain-containing protein [Pseudactinotalea sp. HY158]
MPRQSTRPRPPLPTARGVGLLLVGLALAGAGATTRRPELMWFGVALVCLVLTGLGYGLVRAPLDRRVRVVRVLRPARLQVGRPAAMDLSVQGPIPPWSQLSDRIPEGARRTGGAVSATIEARRRGRLRLGPVLLTGSDPFALTRWRRVTRPSTLEVVWPRTDAIEVDTPWGELSVATRPAGHPVGDVDDATLREYRPGDPLERVHWKATARHSTLLVRQEDPSEAELFHVVLVPGRAADAEGLDRLVDVAASLLASVHGEGWAVTLWTPDPSGRLTGRPVPVLADALTDLALLPGPPPGPVEPPRGALVGTALVVLGEEDPATIGALLDWASHPGLAHLPRPGTWVARFERAGWGVRII